jgi:hypothetical protein
MSLMARQTVSIPERDTSDMALVMTLRATVADTAAAVAFSSARASRHR